jgi:hypothetical protein
MSLRRKALVGLWLAIVGMSFAATGGIVALFDDYPRAAVAALVLPGTAALFVAVRLLADVIVALPGRADDEVDSSA